MKSYSKCALRRNRKAAPVASLPLFAWAEARASLEALYMPRPAQILAQRFALSPSIARLVAEQVGFSMEVVHD